MSCKCRSSPAWIWPTRRPILVISRAGAGSISELCLLGKPGSFGPFSQCGGRSPDEKRDGTLGKRAALLIPDSEAVARLIDTAMDIVRNDVLLEKMQQRILSLAQRDSAARIADIILEIVAEKKSK